MLVFAIGKILSVTINKYNYNCISTVQSRKSSPILGLQCHITKNAVLVGVHVKRIACRGICREIRTGIYFLGVAQKLAFLSPAIFSKQ